MVAGAGAEAGTGALIFAADTAPAAGGGREFRAVEETATRRLVGEAAEIGTVLEVAVSVTLAEEGVTVVEERIFGTGSESGTIPRAALSSADFRIARLMCAVAVAGRIFGAGEEEMAGVTGVEGVSFLAGVRGLDAEEGMASVFL